MYIKNFSRHELNTDQIKAVRSVVEDAEFGVPSSPFFTGVRHLYESINGHVSVIVAPGAMLLELWSAQVGTGLSGETVILVFESDQAARKRGRFAATKLKVFRWVSGAPALTDIVAIEPTVENNFSDGAECSYGTPKAETRTVTVYDAITGHRAVVGLPANLTHLVQDGFKAA